MTYKIKGKRAKLPRTHRSWTQNYKREFNQRRQVLRLDFDNLYRLFSSALTGAEIAKSAGVSKERINFIYNKYFADLFGMTARERHRKIGWKNRENAVRQLSRAAKQDPVLAAIRNSARRVGRSRKIEPVIRRKHKVTAFLRKAVLVDGKNIESVHYIRTVRFSRRRTIAYGSTTIYRQTLEALKHTIFVLDVPFYPRRVVRCKSDKLLKALFSSAQERLSVYIPLDTRPENPRYDFLADEDHWD